jgi:hypothetical protein
VNGIEKTTDATTCVNCPIGRYLSDKGQASWWVSQLFLVFSFLIVVFRLIWFYFCSFLCLQSSLHSRRVPERRRENRMQTVCCEYFFREYCEKGTLRYMCAWPWLFHRKRYLLFLLCRSIRSGGH